jgi:hypothetical protein
MNVLIPAAAAILILLLGFGIFLALLRLLDELSE